MQMKGTSIGYEDSLNTEDIVSVWISNKYFIFLQQLTIRSLKNFTNGQSLRKGSNIGQHLIPDHMKNLTTT